MSGPASDRGTAALFLGIDGGGTGCRARLQTADGRVLGQGLAGPAATRLGIDVSWAAIEIAWTGALAEAGLTLGDAGGIFAAAGVAGYSRAGMPEALAARAHPFASLTFESDGIIACLGAHNGGDGGIVIVGTGSCGFVRIGGVASKVGGYGFPVSDEGSGASLGLRAIQLALRAHDGRLPSSALLEEVLRRFGHDPLQVVAWMDGATATDYAALAPLVVRHAEEGDAQARAIMQDAATAIEGICRALLERGAPRLSLIGGLGSVMEAWLAPDLRRRIHAPLGDALDGAALLAGGPPRTDL